MVSWRVEGTKWDLPRETLMFRLASDDGREVMCGITQIAINDYYRTEDSREAAQANFDKHMEDIVRIAVRLIDDGASNECGAYLITSQVISN
ncbi:MAG: DUF1488 family protein [Pseudomonadota bacterium]